MSRPRLRLPTAAIAVSSIALIVALSGTSYAAFTLPQNSVGTKQLKNSAVTLAKITPAARQALAKVGPKGPQGAQGIQGPQGVQGPKGDQGQPGTPGSARAYAAVICCQKGPLTFDAARTKGFTSVRRAAVGVYCLAVDPTTGINPATVAPVADVEWGDSNYVGFAEVATYFSTDCNSNEIDVHTFDSTGAASSLLAFTILVP